MEASAVRMGGRLTPLQIQRHHRAWPGDPILTFWLGGKGVDGRVKPGHDERRETDAASGGAPYAFFFTSLMLEKTMPSARSLI
jgi:hypothetical protein